MEMKTAVAMTRTLPAMAEDTFLAFLSFMMQIKTPYSPLWASTARFDCYGAE
jgi:hypothetical protein